MKSDDEKRDIEDRIADLREGVTGADATGMVAGEEAIAAAETLLPLEPLPVPSDEMHAALSDASHPAHATIDRLHEEVRRANPDRAEIEGHVAQLRALPEVEATIANWWDSPTTQRFLWNLSQIGL